jgi:hypothetical protein
LVTLGARSTWLAIDTADPILARLPFRLGSFCDQLGNHTWICQLLQGWGILGERCQRRGSLCIPNVCQKGFQVGFI